MRIFQFILILLFLTSIFASPPDELTKEEFEALVLNVKGSNGYVYQLHDSAGHTMDTVKIIDDQNGGYLGVYHSMLANSIFHTFVATSKNLVNWTFQAELGIGASQPHITALSDGGYLVLWEQQGNAPKYDCCNHIRFNYYQTHSILLSGKATKSFDTNQTLSHCAEGTPSLYSAMLMPDIDHSVIDVGAHFYDNCVHDRQQRGVLTNFSIWENKPQPQIDTAIEVWNVTGNIGDRDAATFGGFSYGLFEGQYTFGDWSSWRIYCYDYQTGSADRLNIQTHGGSESLANPAITILKSPSSGKPSLLVTLYIFSQGSVPGEPGQLIYWNEIPEKFPKCEDTIEDCGNYLGLCNLLSYQPMMCQNCMKSCNLCTTCNTTIF